MLPLCLVFLWNLVKLPVSDQAVAGNAEELVFECWQLEHLERCFVGARRLLLLVASWRPGSLGVVVGAERYHGDVGLDARDHARVGAGEDDGVVGRWKVKDEHRVNLAYLGWQALALD